MTSPPPSETGATAAAIAREFCDEHRLVNDAEPALERLIEHIRAEAKRSAHLEDAGAAETIAADHVGCGCTGASSLVQILKAMAE